MLKLNKLFLYTGQTDDFITQIEPLKKQRDYLFSCKNDIRDHLRPKIREATIRVLGMEKAVEPRFRTQGSWSYRTCIQPAWLPPQEMDWDYGVYLPVSVWEKNGPPHKMAKLYFELVEGLLKDLCEQKGWKLLSGGKETCIRISVASWAHIDIPLYAAPEHKFLEILEKSLTLDTAMNRARADSYFAEDQQLGELSAQAWEDLDDIYLATRSGEWRPSDPEAVARWFNDKVDQFGEQLRRVCRYVKAWRDFHWQDGGGPTSIAIMVAVAQNFEARLGRDDLVLESAMQYLSQALLGDLYEIAINDGQDNFNRLSSEERAIASQKARELASVIKQARSYGFNTRHYAIADLQKYMGSRIPNRGEWIEAETSADTVRTTPARQVPAPVVSATSAG